jgi:hypothetical protein
LISARNFLVRFYFTECHRCFISFILSSFTNSFRCVESQERWQGRRLSFGAASIAAASICTPVRERHRAGSSRWDRGSHQ